MAEKRLDADSLKAGPRVLHVIHSLLRSAGGPPLIAIGLCEHLAKAGCKVDICTLDFGARGGPELPVDESLVRVHRVPSRSRFSNILLPRQFERVVTDLGTGAQIVHCHGIWSAANNCAATIAAKLRKPYLITLNGMLAARAMKRSSWKKRLALLLYARRNFARAACLNAATESELKEARRLALPTPIAVIPNGVDPDRYASLPNREVAWERWSDLRDKKLILFMARLHPIKGLPNLIEAWGRLAGDFGDWHLVIAGPDELGLRAELERSVRDSGISERTTFTGPAFDEDKMALLGAASVFCMPSYSEGFSMAILEAVACGLPVLITHGCSFDDVTEVNAGLVVAPNADSLTEGLRSLLTRDEDELTEMGKRGRELIERRYSWNAIAAQMLSVYNWLLGLAPRPSCVQTNEVA